MVSVALSIHPDSYRGVLPVRKRGALYCPDFPPRTRFGAMERLCKGKVFMSIMMVTSIFHALIKLDKALIALFRLSLEGCIDINESIIFTNSSALEVFRIEFDIPHIAILGQCK